MNADDDIDHVTDDQSLLNKQESQTSESDISALRNIWYEENYSKHSFAIQNDPQYFIDHKKCAGCCRGYLRQDWATLDLQDGLEEKKAEWIELFFDLIFVACIVRISYQAMNSIPSIESGGEGEESTHRLLLSESSYEAYCGEQQAGFDFLLCCFAQFGLLTLFWTEQTMIETHFVLNQVMDNIFRLSFMSFVLCLGIFIQDNPWHQLAFQMAYIGVKCICIAIYIKVSMIPKAKTHAIYHIIESCIAIIGLIFVACFFRGCALDYFAIYSAFFLFEYLSIILEWTIYDKQSGQLRFALPLHITHIAERFGLFIMLILGESIISLLAVAEFAEDTVVVAVSFILLTFYMTFMIATLYYDSQPCEEEVMHHTDSHALQTKNRANRLLYLWAHQMLFFGLLALGIGVKISGHHLFDEYISREWIDVLLPSYGLVLIVVSLFVIRVTHPNKAKQNKMYIWILRLMILMIMCVMPIFATKINQAIIFAVMFISLSLLVIIDVEGRQHRMEIKDELKQKRYHARTKSMEEIANRQLKIKKELEKNQELQQLTDK